MKQYFSLGFAPMRRISWILIPGVKDQTLRHPPRMESVVSWLSFHYKHSRRIAERQIRTLEKSGGRKSKDLLQNLQLAFEARPRTAGAAVAQGALETSGPNS